MSHMLRRATDFAHPVSLDVTPAMARARVQTQDMDWPRAVGGAISRAIALVGWSDKEAAGHVGVDPAEFGKWMSGARHPQLDRLFAVEQLRQPLVVCLASLAAGARISTTIEFDARRHLA
jgi:hypothetical protein